MMTDVFNDDIGQIDETNAYFPLAVKLDKPVDITIRHQEPVARIRGNGYIINDALMGSDDSGNVHKTLVAQDKKSKKWIALTTRIPADSKVEAHFRTFKYSAYKDLNTLFMGYTLAGSFALLIFLMIKIVRMEMIVLTKYNVINAMTIGITYFAVGIAVYAIMYFREGYESNFEATLHPSRRTMNLNFRGRLVHFNVDWHYGFFWTDDETTEALFGYTPSNFESLLKPETLAKLFAFSEDYRKCLGRLFSYPASFSNVKATDLGLKPMLDSPIINVKTEDGEGIFPEQLSPDIIVSTPMNSTSTAIEEVSPDESLLTAESIENKKQLAEPSIRRKFLQTVVNVGMDNDFPMEKYARFFFDGGQIYLHDYDDNIQRIDSSSGIKQQVLRLQARIQTQKEAIGKIQTQRNQLLQQKEHLESRLDILNADPESEQDKSIIKEHEQMIKLIDTQITSFHDKNREEEEKLVAEEEKDERFLNTLSLMVNKGLHVIYYLWRDRIASEKEIEQMLSLKEETEKLESKINILQSQLYAKSEIIKQMQKSHVENAKDVDRVIATAVSAIAGTTVVTNPLEEASDVDDAFETHWTNKFGHWDKKKAFQAILYVGIFIGGIVGAVNLSKYIFMSTEGLPAWVFVVMIVAFIVLFLGGMWLFFWGQKKIKNVDVKFEGQTRGGQ